jgi:hypothetical protein
LTNQILYRLSRLRYLVRKQPWVATIAYMLPNVFHALIHRPPHGLPISDPAGKVAMCLRFRDEARFLGEWLDYYIAAGVDHFSFTTISAQIGIGTCCGLIRRVVKLP